MRNINRILVGQNRQELIEWKFVRHFQYYKQLDNYIIIQMQKNKKMITQSSRQQKRTLRITDSPKKVTKLKLGSLLQASKQKEMDQINEVIRQKLEEHPNTASRNKGFNPYQSIYNNDLAYWKEYCEATGRYEQGGINLKWPYYFTAYHQESNQKE